MTVKRFLHAFMIFYVLSETAITVTAQNRCIITPKSPSSLTAIGGKLANNTKNVMIECKCHKGRGGLFKRINWFYSNGKLVSNVLSGVPYTRFNDHKKIMTLVIPEFNFIYSGTYMCSSGLAVPNRNTRAIIDLTLLVPAPNIIQHPKDQVIKLYTNNFNLTLQCEAVGHHLTYMWTQNGSVIVPNNHFNIRNGNLNIINITPSDGGHYQCRATNTGGSNISRYANVMIEVPPPRIITYPTDTSAAAPFSAVFTCSFQAYGKITITWEGNDPLPNPVQVSSPELTTSTLTIPNVTEENVGTYYCVIWANKKGLESNKVQLSLADPPAHPVVVISDPVVHLNVNNFNVSMKCVPDKPSLNYVWEKWNGDFPTRALNRRSSHVILTNVRPEDAGDYRCTFSNSTGKISSNFSTLSVKVSLPVFKSHPKNVQAEVFSNVSLTCEAVGYGIIALIWKRMGLRMPTTATQINSTSGDIVTSTLHIKRANGYYAGEYYCIAENCEGQVTSTIARLRVQVPCPEMIIPPKNITVLPGRAAHFTCLALSHGVLIYDWTRKDHKELPEKSKLSSITWVFPLTHGQLVTVRSLMIFDTELSVEGWYCCTATNECGNVTRCAWLDVNSIPHIKEHPSPKACRRDERNKEVMNCLASGMGHIHYRWEKYQPLDNSWIRPSERVENITSPKLLLNVVTEEDEGVYRCVVTNDDGSVVSDNATLTVYGPPIIINVSNAITVKEGEKAYFTCTVRNDVDSTYPVSIKWYDGKGVQLKSDAATNMSELLIDPVDISDDGVYMCQAFNHPKSIAEQQIRLTVQYPPNVIINTSPSEDDKVIVFCEAEGRPTPFVELYTGGKSVSGPKEEQLFKSNISKGNTTYTCKAWNDVGTDSKSISI